MKVIRLKQAFSATAVLALLSIATSALAQFVWLDEKGVKQYSDMPPPASVPNQRILKAPSQNLPRANGAGEAGVGVADGSDSKPDTKAPPSFADQNAAFQKRKAEQAEKDKKSAQEAKQKADKANNCANARANQRTLDSGARIAQTDANGQRSYISDAQRAQQTQENRRILDECQ